MCRRRGIRSTIRSGVDGDSSPGQAETRRRYRQQILCQSRHELGGHMTREDAPVLTVLNLGWGRQSMCLAGMMALDYIPRADYLIHADTTHEYRATYAYAEAMTPWLQERGLTVVTVRGRRTQTHPVVYDWGGGATKRPSVSIPAFTLDKSTGSHGQVRRQCTEDWKIAPARRFISAELKRRGLGKKAGAVEQMLGITADEWRRVRDSDVAYIVNRYPLVEMRMTRRDCERWLADHDIPIPPKSACTFCPYHNLAEWRRLRRAGGEDWELAVAADEAIRDKRPDHNLYVHPARVPLAQAVELPEDTGQLALLEIDAEAPCDSGYCYT